MLWSQFEAATLFWALTKATKIREKEMTEERGMAYDRGTKMMEDGGEEQVEKDDERSQNFTWTSGLLWMYFLPDSFSCKPN